MIRFFSILICVACCLAVSCRDDSTKKGRVRVFLASGLSALTSDLKPIARDDADIIVEAEASGSQVVCRKVVELGRECDLMMLADPDLFKKMAAEKCMWRLDFAYDEIVLGVGVRARDIDRAERDWQSVLLGDDVVLARANENMGPIGYRTFLVWYLKGNDDGKLMNELKKKSSKVVDNVSAIAALLKSGDVDYGFLYKSSCISYDLRFISLTDQINLGSDAVDYSRAVVSYGNNNDIRVVGKPVTFSLSIPVGAANPAGAAKLVYLLLKSHQELIAKHGFRVIKPRFYGNRKDYELFKEYADYAGGF